MAKFQLFKSTGYPEDGLPNPQRRWAVLSAMLGIFMSVLDITIMNVVLPDLAKTFEVSNSSIIWLVNIYQLAIVTTLLPLSFVGDIFGYNKVFLFGTLLFVLGSLGCALSPTFEVLVFARFMQGIGASAITSVNQAQLRTIYPKRMIGQGLAVSAVVVSVSSAAGPTIAGGILTLLSWHWLFAVNVPIGLIAIFMGLRYLPRLKTRRPEPFDWRASILNAVSFGSFVYLFEHIAYRESIYVLIPLLILFVTSLMLYIRHEKRKAVPMLPLDLLRIPIFKISLFTSVCSFIANMLAMVSLPFLLQNTLKYNAIETGLLLTPWPLATIITAPIAGRLVSRVHPGLLGAIGMAIFFVGLLGIAFLPANPSIVLIVTMLMLCGMGFGLFQTPNNTTIMTSAPKRRSGGASGMLGVARLAGQTIGATGVALLFNYVSDSKEMFFCFTIAAVFALLAGVFSISRVSMQFTLAKSKEGE